MSDEWSQFLLGDVTHIQQGRTLAVKAMRGGGHQVYGANGVIGQYEVGTYDFPVVALGCRGSCGTVHIAEAQSFLAGNVMGVWPKDSEVLHLNFLALLLEVADLQATGVISGQVQPQITRTSLSRLEVRFPSFTAQRRIVDLMTHLDAHIANLRTEREALVGVRSTSLMMAMQGDLPAMSIDDEWVDATLGHIATWGAGGTPKASEPKFYEDGSIPWAVIADVQNDYISTTEKCITEEGLKKIGHSAPEGSVLVTMYGTIGRVAITTRRMATNQAIAWATPDTEKVSAEFLFYWLRYHQPELDKQARGATQRNINRAILKDTRMTLPPLLIQRRIVDLLAGIEAGISALDVETQLLTDLRSRVLSSLLEGSVTIPTHYDHLLQKVS